ncbi:hypothetical protein [Escherichia coli]|uniref:hypothetical protein n=1 Tax=Escherichia coli TaxID=562 RepID=UPI000DE4DF41|nr:hypothetical protein [Escherichia coli]
MRQQQDEPGRFSICSRQAAVVPTCAKPLKAPATEPMDIPVKGASQFWAMFIAAPWLIYPVTWY